MTVSASSSLMAVFTSASLPLPMNVRGSGAARCWTISPTGSTPAVRMSSEISFSSSAGSVPGETTTTQSPRSGSAPGTRFVLGSGIRLGLCPAPRSVRCRRARPRRPARRDDARARGHSVGEPRRGRGGRVGRSATRGRTRFARAFGRFGAAVRVAAPPGRSLGAPRRAPGHGSRAGEPARPDRGRRRARARRERHEGRLRRDGGAGALARFPGARCRVPVLPARGAAGRGELAAGCVRGVSRGARGGSRDLPRADEQRPPPRLPREPERASSSSTARARIRRGPGRA